MAKRFSETGVWREDWFIEMPPEYKLFWFFVLSNCDHAGVFKVNLTLFCRLNGVKVDSNLALDLFNFQKERIRVINASTWFIEDFFVFQYGTTANLHNRVHFSIFKEFKKNEIKVTSIRGLKDLKDGVKEIDIDSFDLNNLNNYGKNDKNGDDSAQGKPILPPGIAQELRAD